MPTPSSFAIARQGVPEARNASILDSLTKTRGRPSLTPLAFACVGQPAFTLLDQGTFKLGHGADDLKHEPARRRRQVEIVAQADEGQSQGIEFRQSVDQMAMRATESVQLPNKHRV
jgi:hypothetical protein